MLDVEDAADNDDLGVDKAATPAERAWSAEALGRNMERIRPTVLLAERESDAATEIEASRCSALSRLSCLELCTGSKLVDQFQGSYIPRVFNLTLPW